MYPVVENDRGLRRFKTFVDDRGNGVFQRDGVSSRIRVQSNDRTVNTRREEKQSSFGGQEVRPGTSS